MLLDTQHPDFLPSFLALLQWLLFLQWHWKKDSRGSEWAWVCLENTSVFHLPCAPYVYQRSKKTLKYEHSNISYKIYTKNAAAILRNRSVTKKSQKDNTVWFYLIDILSQNHRQKVEWWLSGTRGEVGIRSYCLMGIVSVSQKELWRWMLVMVAEHYARI